MVKELDNEEYEIPKEKIIKTQEILFDFVADQVASFIKDRKITKKLPMGFTFSFPVHNTSLTSGTLVRWTKCFDADGAVGEDPVRLLRDAFDRKGVCVIFQCIKSLLRRTHVQCHSLSDKRNNLRVVYTVNNKAFH